MHCRRYRPHHPNRPLLPPTSASVYFPQHPCARFELYKGYLKQLLERDSEAGVMLTDSRDVLLQADPWEHPLVQQILDEVRVAAVVVRCQVIRHQGCQVLRHALPQCRPFYALYRCPG